VILLGVVAANEEWFEKANFDRIPKLSRILVGIVLFAALVIIRQNYFVYNNFAYLLDGAIAVFFAWFAKELFGGISGVKQALRFLGKHSMNMYFIHSFIYMIIYQEFIYSFRYAGLIFAVLLAICLVYSVCLEGIKKSAIRLWKK
jgi:peptidoglycan/LPS O-acetylase OafA/YrhL